MSENEEYVPNVMSLNVNELIDIANKSNSNTADVLSNNSTISTQTDVSVDATNYSIHTRMKMHEELLFISMIFIALLTYWFTIVVYWLFVFAK